MVDNRLVDWLTEQLNLEATTVAKIIYTIATIAVILIIRSLVLRYIDRNTDDHDAQYRARKIINYAVTAVFLVTIAFIWIDAFENLSTYLGLLSAGIAIALADVLKNMAGWIYILGRRPLQVGDRIEVIGLKGDVVDIRLFRFTLMEVQGWVDAEQSTGRLVHVPNGVVFTQPVANYTEGFAYVWHETPVLVTFESDWKLAEKLILEALEEQAPNVERTAGPLIRETARRYSIRMGTLTPTVYVTVRDSGVLLTARFLVETRTRRGREDRVWRAVLEKFAETPSVELAYPTVRTYLHDVVQLETVDAREPG